MTRPRGRPRAYDPDRALDAALEVFWARGFAATTLDALSEVTGMKRPSLYAAFGDKSALFDRCLARFEARMREASASALAEPDVEVALRALLTGVVDVYAPPGAPSRGCLLFGVASLESVEDERLRETVARAVRDLDRAIAQRFRQAVHDGQLPGRADPDTLGRMASALVHSLSLRARTGTGRRALLTFARASADTLIRAARAC